MTSKQMEILTNIIGGVESGGQIYGRRNYAGYAAPYANSPSEHTVTLGWAQNYGANARELCKRILKKDPAAFRAADSAGIEEKLKVNWVTQRWNPNAAQKNALIAIITTDAGKAVQDQMFQELAQTYIKSAEAFGVTDVAAQMMWCEIQHLGGFEPTIRIFNRAAKPYTPDSIFASLMRDQNDTSNNNQVGDKLYQSRHECCVLWIKQYLTDENQKNEEAAGVSEIDKIYAEAAKEIGYLEKATNAQLDDKTANAGYNNYTKYWRDTRKRGRMAAYGYSKDSSFAGGVNWPYCADGIDDTFCRALGVERAKELLLHGDAAFINCETMYQKAVAAKRIINAPRPGCLPLFKKSGGEHYHVEFCYAVKDGVMYTIGWNTSGASSVIANGGGVCDKHYLISSVRADYFMPAYNSEQASIPVNPGTSLTLLKYGSSGSAVKDMQKKLIALGYSCGDAGADGNFGTCTLAAVKSFQQDHSLAADGIFGELTAAELNKAYANRNSTDASDPVNSQVLFVGKINRDNVDVRTWAGREYGNIKSWPKLNKGNLVDVLDYTQKDTQGKKWYFIRIAGKYHGFVPKKNTDKA